MNQHFPIIKTVKFGFLNKDERMEVLFCFGSDRMQGLSDSLSWSRRTKGSHVGAVARMVPNTVPFAVPVLSICAKSRSLVPVGLQRQELWLHSQDVGGFQRNDRSGPAPSSLSAPSAQVPADEQRSQPGSRNVGWAAGPFDAKMFVKPGGPAPFVDFRWNSCQWSQVVET